MDTAFCPFTGSLSPLPVTIVVTVSFGLMIPNSTAFLIPAIAATPAGSPKIPSVLPSNPIALMISSSGTATQAPFENLIALSALIGLRGMPTAMESAKVFSSASLSGSPVSLEITNGQHPVD